MRVYVWGAGYSCAWLLGNCRFPPCPPPLIWIWMAAASPYRPGVCWMPAPCCSPLTPPSLPPHPPPPSPQDGSSLTHIGLACIWRVLDAYALLPLNSMCRLLAQNGAVPRLFVVLKQVCVWGGGVRLGPCLASLWC